MENKTYALHQNLVNTTTYATNIVILNHIYHHKLHGSRLGNNFHAKFVFHRFIWNRHGCHSSICLL